MNKDQAVKFLNALNRSQAHLPPLIWDPIAECEVVRAVLAIANGAATCEFKPAAVDSGNGSLLDPRADPRARNAGGIE
jgi:hypothetical protein